MLSVTNHLLCVVLLLGLAIAEASAQQNQQKECFTVIMNNSTGGGSLGAIFLNKCTGDSWICPHHSRQGGNHEQVVSHLNREE